MRPTRFFAALLILALLLPGRARSEEEVFCIGSFRELAAFSELVARGKAPDHAVLTSDIEADAPLRAIGTPSSMFSGLFDGQDHVIKNLIVSGPSGSQGLFGCIGPDGTVKNVRLENAVISGADLTGGIAGYSAGRIENCRVTDSRVIGRSRSGYGTATGGIAALASGEIARCAVSGCAVSGGGSTGGVAGALHAGSAEGCVFSGVVVCIGTGTAPCGGVLGSLHAGASLKDCLATGAVLAFLTDCTGGVLGGAFGGVAENCAFFGAVSSQGEKTGAVAGWCDQRAQLAACLFDPYAASRRPVGKGAPGTARPCGALRFRPYI